MEQFFRTHYRAMCSYCAQFGFNFWDVEEMVADVILSDYEKHKGDGLPEISIRRYLNRRVMLNLKSLYKMRVHYSRTRGILPGDEMIDLADPESIVCLQQRLPSAIHPILIDYAQHGGTVTAKGENTNADRTRFCRERKKFLTALKGSQ